MGPRLGTPRYYKQIAAAFDPLVRRVDVYCAFPRPGEVTLAVRWWPWVRRQRERAAALQLLIQPRDVAGRPDEDLSAAPFGALVHVERA